MPTEALVPPVTHIQYDPYGNILCLLFSDRSCPPIALPAVVEQHLRVAHAGEVAGPELMLAIEQVAESCGVFRLAPRQRVLVSAKPPVVIAADIEQHLEVPGAGEVREQALRRGRNGTTV